MKEHKSDSSASQGAGSSHTSCTEWQGGHRIVREYMQTASPQPYTCPQPQGQVENGSQGGVLPGGDAGGMAVKGHGEGGGRGREQ